jgi:L-lactate dehydrogenase complex protein LldE
VKVALFVPCYVDQCYPQVALSTVKVLKSVGVEVEFPRLQTCCGQPFVNSGFTEEGRHLARHFVRVFREYDHVVCPSASCTAMVRHHFAPFLENDADFARLRPRVLELCEFLVSVRGHSSWEGAFPYRVGLHQSCHSLRELGLASPSEVQREQPNWPAQLLGSLLGIELCPLGRADECCGFGGLFSWDQEQVSVAMGRDRLAEHQRAQVQVLTSVDMSCLMHLQGIARRNGDGLRVHHVAEILAGDLS